MKTLFTYNAGSFSIFCEFRGFRRFARSRFADIGMCVSSDMYHSDEDSDTEKVWESFPQQKGLLEREFPESHNLIACKR